MILQNRLNEYEYEMGFILANLAYHIHPKIISRIQYINRNEQSYFDELFAGKIDTENYLYDGSACVFPGVRRYVSGKGKKRSYNFEYQAIIDDNTFPRHIWCFLKSGKTYSGPNWEKSELSEFELAHIFTHKESELEFEKQFFSEIDDDLLPFGDFSCASNVILLPKGTARPTDNSRIIKAVFYKRYIDLYGEDSLNGRSGFRIGEVPKWYSELKWNEPYLPENWEKNIEALMNYRTKRITKIVQKAFPVSSTNSPAVSVTKSNLVHKQSKKGINGDFPKLSKIELWAKHPNQFNHKIVRAFLNLSEAGNVSIDSLRSHCVKQGILAKNFNSHFASMKTNAGNSHGKIFEEFDNGSVAIPTTVLMEIKRHF
ncbi:hypothetical protein A9Q83_01395 [Alphaproteobacteria bacterium 46_93_T64]|nr:hypothetical protein A9Q83_01395 [Alphaproteobacteria bacterium 46_93_T64]